MADESDNEKSPGGELPDPPLSFKERPWPRPWMGEFLEALSRTPFVTAAADAAHINRQHTYDVRAANPEFAAAWVEAQAQAVELLERSVHRWATTGLPKVETRRKQVRDLEGNVIGEEVTTVEGTDVNPTLAMFVLKRFKPEYRESYRLEHTGADGGPMVVQHEQKLAEAVEEFDAEVVRLSEVREAKQAAG